MSGTIEFWFELASTYSYLAAMRIEALAAAAGKTVVWRPFLLGPILKASYGTMDSPFNLFPARGAHMWVDVMRQAKALGLTMRRPSTFPRGSLLGTRIAVLGEDAPWVGAFVRRLFTLNFVDDRDINQEDVVAEVLRELDLPLDLIARAQAPELKERLRERTRDAEARGIFGAPTFFADGEMYWGNDRLEEALGLSTFAGMHRDDARAFAARWLPAWTGNDPERLLSFYADDALYLDPAVPLGLRGRDAILAYFKKLLRRYPDWVWTQREAIPMQHGFVNLWHASVPHGDRTVDIDGLCFVVLRGDRIVRNEVYFDRTLLA